MGLFYFQQLSANLHEYNDLLNQAPGWCASHIYREDIQTVDWLVKQAFEGLGQYGLVL